MNAFKIIGADDEGKCDHCGANCPKRRVLVETANGVESWGVICASKVRGDRGTSTDVKVLTKFSAFVSSMRAAVASGATLSDLSRLNRNNFPTDFRSNEIRMWADAGNRTADAVIVIA